MQRVAPRRVLRALSAVVALAAVATTVVACSSAEDDVDTQPNPARDSGQDQTMSGTGGSGFGGTGFGGTGFGGTSSGGTSSGGSGGSAFGGTSSGGTGGSADSGLSGGSGGGSGGAPTCNAAFCPNSGVGTPCCVTPNGPCGSDTGNGCQSNVSDF